MHRKRQLAFIAATAMAVVLVSVRPLTVGAADASMVLSLPWTAGQNGTMTFGPHNWGGANHPVQPFNSLDLVPSDGKVLATRGGIAHINDCGAEGMVRIDHNDGGYQTTYYHLQQGSIRVTEGQSINRGDWLGNIGTSIPCGGSAAAAHTHFSIWKFTGAPNFRDFGWTDGASIDWNNKQIGAWVLDVGLPNPSSGAGCMTPVTGGGRQCPSTVITNDLNPMVVDGSQGDVNRDFQVDVVAVSDANTFVMLSNGAAFGPAQAWSNTPFNGSRANLIGDVNGDLRADLVAVNNDGSVYVMRSSVSGTSFLAPEQWFPGPFAGTRAMLLADVNGDGKADLVAVNDNTVWVMLSTGTGFGPPQLWSNIPFYGTRATLIGDVNGDGLADLVAVNNDGSAWVLLSNGSGFVSSGRWFPGPFTGTRAMLLGNVAGSGKAALVAVNEADVWVMTSTGSAFNAPSQWLANSNKPSYGTRVTFIADVRFVLRADLVAVNDGNTYVMPSTGTGFSPPGDAWSNQPFFGSKATL